MQSDADGNLYMADVETGSIRALRKRDNMLLTLSGNGHVSAGRAPLREGPSYELNLDEGVSIAATGRPLDGEGSLYLATAGRIRPDCYRNKERGGLWWYRTVAGGGKAPLGARTNTRRRLYASGIRPRSRLQTKGSVSSLRLVAAKRNVTFFFGLQETG